MTENPKEPQPDQKDVQPEGIHKEHKKEKYHHLQEEIDKLHAEKDELFAKLQRVSADYMNYQKRSAKQILESIAYEKETIIKSFLPVLDNFEHTLSNVENTKELESFHKGIKMIYEQMLSVFKNYGIEQISSIGQKFDPSCHQAIMQETNSDKEDGIILKEVLKGYKAGDKIIRPARVIVNKNSADIKTQASAAGQDLSGQQGDIEEDEDLTGEDSQ